jgi:hypothetical protein
VHPHPHQPGADFTIMIECTPEIGHCHSVRTLWASHATLEPGVLSADLAQVGTKTMAIRRVVEQRIVS